MALEVERKACKIIFFVSVGARSIADSKRAVGEIPELMDFSVSLCAAEEAIENDEAALVGVGAEGGGELSGFAPIPLGGTPPGCFESRFFNKSLKRTSKASSGISRPS